MQTSEGSEPTASVRASSSRQLNVFCPDLCTTNRLIWAWLSYFMALPSQRVSCEDFGQSQGSQPSIWMSSVLSLCYCLCFSPRHTLCQRVCPAPKTQTSSPCSLSHINQLACALLCGFVCVCLYQQSLSLCKCARRRARGAHACAAWCQLPLCSRTNRRCPKFCVA